MSSERRKRRSTQPNLALSLYLESLADRQLWDAVAFADRDGLLLGGLGRGIDPEAMAAVAPLAARDAPHPPEGLLGLVTRGRPLNVWGVTLDGDSFYLVSVGPGAAPATETYEALGRILGSVCAAAC